MADSGSGGADGHLTNSQIVLLGSAIASDNMRKIATVYMDLSNEVVRNIVDKNRDDQEGITRELIEKWKNKPQNSDHNQVKKLASILYQAADEGDFVDPDKIQKILQVSREDLLAGLRDVPVTERELSELAEKLRSITEGRTNIDMIQWAENNTVKMEDLYTELKIDKLENEPAGVQSVAVNDYRELFKQGPVSSVRRLKGKRVLGKGDPGNGKTTFAKKVAWDWAKGNVKDFSLVFFVSMKLVEQGDLTEGMIIQQTPELEGLKVTEQKLRDILETFGSRCLVILDGYDEHLSHDNKPNEDVVKLLRGQKFLSCNVLETSRPHSIADLEQHFSTVVSIQGFTEKHAKEFASRVLIDKDKIDPIMEIQCLNAGEYIREGNSVFTCPLLLLFICVLVNGDEIDLARKEVTLGEIYTRLVRCLYRKYTVRKGKTFKQSEFVEVLKRVGFLAWETLFFVKMVLQRNKVVRDVGEEAFDYGLLTGHEDFRLSADETGDIIISFAHRTIQEFLGALYFILMFDCGEIDENIDDLKVVIMTRPLLLHFCLWFLGKHCTDEFFSLQNKNELYRQIETTSMNRINFTNFDSTTIATAYPALNLGCAQRDELVEQFVQRIWPKCKKIKHLLISKEDPIHQVMSTLHPLLPQLSSIQLPLLWTDAFCSEEIHIVIDHESISCTDEVLTHCKGLDKPLSVCFMVREPEDLCKYLTAHISALHIVAADLSVNSLSRLHNIPYSPHLTSLFLYKQILDEDFILALSNIVEQGNLPNLRRLRFCRCDIKGKLHLLFQSKWPTLTHLDLSESYLDERDIGFLGNVKVLLPNLTSVVLYLGDGFADVAMTEMFVLFRRMFHSDNVRFRFPRRIALFDMFESPLPNMTELWMDGMNKEEYKRLVSAINMGNLPKLRELGISMSDHLVKNQMVDTVALQIKRDCRQIDVIVQGETLDWLPSVNVPTLTHLTLHKFICSIFHLAMVMQSTVLTNLHKLDISHSSGMTGTLSILLCHSFPSLNSLTLSDCGLNSQDLCSLAQARAKGRLPELKYLDISKNDSIKGEMKCLFSYDAQWENLCSLNALHDCTQGLNQESHQFCIHKVSPSDELAISESIDFLFQPGNRCWENVEKVFVSCDANSQNKIFSEILDALERGLLPALKCVSQEQPEDQGISYIRPLLVNKLPNNVIENVIEHVEGFLEVEFIYHFMAVTNDNIKKRISGESSVPEDTVIEKVIETFDMSSVHSLAEDERLTESQTKELIDAICTYLRKFQTGRALSRHVDNKTLFNKYGVDYNP